MTIDGIAFIRSLTERDGHDAVLLLSDETEWIVPGDERYGGGVHRGPAELLRFFETVRDLFPHGLTVRRARQWRGDGAVVVEVELAGETAAGRRYDNRYVFVLDLLDGRIRRIEEYTDTARAQRMLDEEAP